MKQLLLSEREVTALNDALELYIRLGLGQISEVGKKIQVLMEKRDVEIEEFENVGEGWSLEDEGTHSLVVAVFGIQAKLGGVHAAWEWACKRLYERGDLE